MIIPAILCGGSGTRLWPLSRQDYPKQFLCLTSDTHSLLQQTLLRAQQLCPEVAPMLLCNQAHRFLVAEQLDALGITPSHFLLEPAVRNTAPAITLAALQAIEVDSDASLLVMPSDHLVQDVAALDRAVAQASQLAQQLVTFGINPTHAETGYGYIQAGEALAEGFKIAQFVEKPDQVTAEQYLKSGDYYWNSGMFMLPAQLFLQELEAHQPAILQACQQAFEQRHTSNGFTFIDEAAFNASPEDSIDYAVMEKTQHAAVVPLEAGWNDVGSWDALHAIGPTDGDGNLTRGDVILNDAKDNLVFAQDRLVAVAGLNNHVIVETDDAVLVAHQDHCQDIKKIATTLKSQQRAEAIHHTKVARPWGSYQSLAQDTGFQVKRIIVKIGGCLSLQMHQHRAEHWVVVRGVAEVTRDDEVFTLNENESTYIPIGSKHRLKNIGTTALEIIEIQSGSYLGEDDITRFEDQYGR